MNIFWINGRCGRLAYFCVAFLAGIVQHFANEFSRGKTDTAIGYFLGFVIVVCLWIIICVGAKRCHDLGHSGWWQLIPFYGLWLLFAEGDPDDNEYGSAG